jgi:hypothetical protein
MIDKFEASVLEVRTQAFQKVQESYEHTTSTINNLGLKAEERQLLEANRKNPRALCKANIEIVKQKKKDASEWHRISSILRGRIEKAIEKRKELVDLERNSHDIFGSETKIILYNFIRNKIDPSNPPASIQPLLEEAKIEINESYIMAKTNLMEAQEAQNLSSDCGDLPETLDGVDACSNASFTTKAAALWKVLTFANFKDCLVAHGVGFIVQRVLMVVIEKVISILANIFSLFAITILKVVYFALKLGHYLYKAHKTDNLKKRSGHLGNAVGTAVRIVLVIVGVEKRRRKK